jgi:UDP-4-amino-4,6-dideoxy-N-acetyl-beta-L-altrosamine transaminase
VTTPNNRVLGYGRQSIDPSDIEAVVGVLQSEFLTQGPTIERFEAALAQRCGATHAVAVSNGTAALHLACLAAGLGSGDLGVTAAITFAASANCLRYVGADVTFTDIDPNTLGMAPASLKRVLGRAPHAKAVIPVHMAGLAHAAAEIRELAGRRLVIEDAAHSLGGAYPCGKPIGCGAYSDMAIFSFHPVKSITTGEGGAVVTNDAELARRLRMLRNHGLERSPDRFVNTDTDEAGVTKPWLYEQQALGFNYRLTDIQAALGLAQIGRLDGFLARRRAIAARYDAAFASLPGVEIPQSAAHDRARSGLHLYVAKFDWAALGTTRTRLMARLRERGIGSQVHYIPVYRHPYYSERYQFNPAEFPEAERYYGACLSLPLYPGLTDDDVERVIQTLKQVLAE